MILNLDVSVKVSPSPSRAPVSPRPLTLSADVRTYHSRHPAGPIAAAPRQLCEFDSGRLAHIHHVANTTRYVPTLRVRYKI